MQLKGRFTREFGTDINVGTELHRNLIITFS